MGKGNGSFSEKQTKGIFLFAFAYLYFLISLKLCHSFFMFESDKRVHWGLCGNPGCLSPDWLCELGQVPTSLGAVLRNTCNQVAL